MPKSPETQNGKCQICGGEVDYTIYFKGRRKPLLACSDHVFLRIGLHKKRLKKKK